MAGSLNLRLRPRENDQGGHHRFVRLADLRGQPDHRRRLLGVVRRLPEAQLRIPTLRVPKRLRGPRQITRVDERMACRCVGVV